MGFKYGTGLSLADRWANYVYLNAQRLLGGTVQLDSGVLELGIDFAQCPFFNFNGHNLYSLIDVTASQPNFRIKGKVNGLGLPTTYLRIFPDSTSETFFTEDFWFIYLRAETNRVRETYLENLSVWSPTSMNTAVFPYGAGRQSVACFVKHTCTNDKDTVNMVGQLGDLVSMTNVHCDEFFKFPGFFDTASGSYSRMEFTQCTLRGDVDGLHIFGAGASALQPGKRISLTDCKFPAAYKQPPGPEIATYGGNGAYIHPVVRGTVIGCEFGTAAGGIVHWLPERGLYCNGGTTGWGLPWTIKNCIFHPNCYQGLKMQAGLDPDGNPQRYDISNCQFNSYWRAVTNDDADARISNCTFKGGEITSAFAAEARMEISDSTVDVQYATPPPEYWTGMLESDVTLVDSIAGHITAKNVTMTLNADRYGVQASGNVTDHSEFIGENVIVNVVGNRSSFAAFLNAANGKMVLRRCGGGGQTRPLYIIRPAPSSTPGVAGGETMRTVHCDFSGFTLAYRATLDQAGNEYTAHIDSHTKLPDLSPTLTGTMVQQFALGDDGSKKTIASAGTITLSPNFRHYLVTGSTTISTINIPAASGNGNHLYDGEPFSLEAAAGAAWPLSAAGNITPLSTLPRAPGSILWLRFNNALGKLVEMPPVIQPQLGLAQVRP